MPIDENDIISKIAEATAKGTTSEILRKLSGVINYPKKKYYIRKFGPKAKSKKGLRLGRIIEEESDKVYIFDDKAKKYYWIKNRKIRDGLGYAGSDTNEEIYRTQIKDYKEGNPIY